MHRWWLLVGLLLTAPVLAQLQVEDARVRGLPPGQTVTAGFAVLNNRGDDDIVLVAVRAVIAERVEVHQSAEVDGMMRMSPVEKITIPAHGRVSFEPGGYHLMLMGLKRPLLEGEALPLTLVADSGLEYEAEFTVVSVLREHQGHAHHHDD